MNAMTLHMSVAIPNFSIFETVSVDVPWRKELVRETLQFENGAILAPTAPGLGRGTQRGSLRPLSLYAL
jgi:galactonate dehydratase